MGHPWRGQVMLRVREAVDAYRRSAAELSDLERQENKSKTGVPARTAWYRSVGKKYPSLSRIMS